MDLRELRFPRTKDEPSTDRLARAIDRAAKDMGVTRKQTVSNFFITDDGKTFAVDVWDEDPSGFLGLGPIWLEA